MSIVNSVFPKANNLLVVIHAERIDQAMRNVGIAFNNGADGVFLINHNISPTDLMFFYRLIRGHFRQKWIGLNILGLSTFESLKLMDSSVSGLWVDDAGVYEDVRKNTKTKILAKMRKRLPLSRSMNKSFLFFGGVAFKYQREIRDTAYAARLAAPYVDVVTTSGSGTGVAANLEKIRIMAEAIDPHPLAIASGTTPENAHEYTPYTKFLLCATGISNSHTELNEGRIRKFADTIS